MLRIYRCIPFEDDELLALWLFRLAAENAMTPVRFINSQYYHRKRPETRSK